MAIVSHPNRPNARKKKPGGSCRMCNHTSTNGSIDSKLRIWRKIMGMISNCCGVHAAHESQELSEICAECGEHCEYIDEKEDEDQDI